MVITVENTDEIRTVYVPVNGILKDEMSLVFRAAINAAELHLCAAQRAGEPLSTNFAAALNAVKHAEESLNDKSQIPCVSGNSPGDDESRNNDFSTALLSAYGFSQTPHKNINPHSIKGFESLQPLANLMHRHCIYT